MPKVMIGIPNEGLTKPEAYDNHIVWAMHLGALVESTKGSPDPYDIMWSTTGRILTPYAREQLAERAVQAGADYLCMLDDDMVIYTDQMDILERLIARKVDIVAPLAFTRNPPHNPVMYDLKTGFEPGTKRRFQKAYHIRNYPKGELVQVDAVGFGMVLIDMKVVKALKNPRFMTTNGSGEDIWFCINAGEAGFNVFMDTSLKLGHLGSPKLITEDTYEAEGSVEEYRKVYGTYERGGSYIDSENAGKLVGQPE